MFFTNVVGRNVHLIYLYNAHIFSRQEIIHYNARKKCSLAQYDIKSELFFSVRELSYDWNIKLIKEQTYNRKGLNLKRMTKERGRGDSNESKKKKKK